MRNGYVVRLNYKVFVLYSREIPEGGRYQRGGRFTTGYLCKIEENDTQ